MSLFVEPLAGFRHVLVTRRRTKLDFAHVIRYLVDVVYPDAEWVDLVMDDLNTNTHLEDTLIGSLAKQKRNAFSSEFAFITSHPMPPGSTGQRLRSA